MRSTSLWIIEKERSRRDFSCYSIRCFLKLRFHSIHCQKKETGTVKVANGTDEFWTTNVILWTPTSPDSDYRYNDTHVLSKFTTRKILPIGAYVQSQNCAIRRAAEMAGSLSNCLNFILCSLSKLDSMFWQHFEVWLRSLLFPVLSLGSSQQSNELLLLGLFTIYFKFLSYFAYTSCGLLSANRQQTEDEWSIWCISRNWRIYYMADWSDMKFVTIFSQVSA